MKKPTPIQFAADLFFAFQDAQTVCQKNPHEPVFTLSATINILKHYEWPVPDFEGFAKAITDKSIPKSSRIKHQVSKKIKEALKAKGLTQREFAFMIGKKDSTVTRLLSSKNMTIDNIILIQEKLNIKLLDL